MISLTCKTGRRTSTPTLLSLPKTSTQTSCTTQSRVKASFASMADASQTSASSKCTMRSTLASKVAIEEGREASLSDGKKSNLALKMLRKEAMGSRGEGSIMAYH